MAHVQSNAVRASATPMQKPSTGGLAPWRENLVKQLILDGLSDTLEVTELARACALSRSHFSRAFKCSTGVSPQDWIRCQRINKAKQLIRDTDLTLTQISLECGFCDQAHFCHIFTRSEGINPFAWRCKVVRAISCTRGPNRKPVASELARAGLRSSPDLSVTTQIL
ncbi:AraC family transcriptional regulator [Pseudomonas sp. SJZ131]|uniref:helix-turn-helix domain-containing protein n=1 Tax=Pseudomonas sp. SJZ131 TaxID=2572895 RepID=UPI00119BF050|nr:AraC family transcriptional regulator [Pseudomonas sp. SJZ131]TWD50341.1 AraC-like DNA-binding protein [Pseudomonas sp. SJZ131]